MSQEFEEWSLARGGPTRQTPINRFGKWYYALKAAGISAASYTVERERRHSEEDLWAAVIEFFSTERESFSFNAFSDWLSRVPELPSGSLIRVRLGLSWSELSHTARRVIAGCTEGMDREWAQRILVRRDWSTLVPPKADPVEVLRQAIPEIGPVVTMAQYSRWAQENGAPPANTLIQRSKMNWSELVGKAGGRVGTRGRRGSIPDNELLEPLAQYLSEGNRASYEGYTQWAQQRHRPVAGTIAHRFGSWNRAVTEARSSLEEDRFT